MSNLNEKSFFPIVDFLKKGLIYISTTLISHWRKMKWIKGKIQDNLIALICYLSLLRSGSINIYFYIVWKSKKIKNKIIYPFRSSTNISYVFRVPLFAMQTPFTHVFLSSVLKLNEIEMRFLRKYFILHVGNEYSLVPEVYAVLWILVDSAKCDARTLRQSIGLFVVIKQIP